MVYAVLLAAGAWYGSRWGIVGVAWAVAGVLVVYALLFGHLAFRCVGFGPAHYLRALRGPAIAAVGGSVAAAAMRAVGAAMGIAPGLNAALTVIIGGGVALLIVVFIPFAELQYARRELRTELCRAVSRRRPAYGNPGDGQG